MAGLISGKVERIFNHRILRFTGLKMSENEATGQRVPLVGGYESDQNSLGMMPDAVQGSRRGIRNFFKEEGNPQ